MTIRERVTHPDRKGGDSDEMAVDTILTNAIILDYLRGLGGQVICQRKNNYLRLCEGGDKSCAWKKGRCPLFPFFCPLFLLFLLLFLCW